MLAQLALAALIVGAGIAGPPWSANASSLRVAAGILIGAAGWTLLVAGVLGLGSSLTPFPRPPERSILRMGGAYRLARHPIYGGSMLVALAWSLLSSPLTLVPTALVVILFELKSRYEESMLTIRFPEYEAYRRRVRWRFIPGVH